MPHSTAADAQSKLLTLEEWSRLDEDVEGELVGGVLEEEEMPSVLHEVVVAWLIEVLRRWTRRHGGLVAGSETKLAIAPRRGRKPDVSLYTKGGKPALSDTLVRVAPRLVVEVTSPRPRDARRDRVDKLRDYARARIRHYLILDPQLRSFEVFELQANGRYGVARTASSGSVRIPGCRGLAFDLDDLWNEIERSEREESRAERKSRS
jgi:Uma2 family endonuclease